MKLEFKIEGFDDLQKEFEILGDKLLAEVEDAVIKSAHMVVRDAKINSKKGPPKFPSRRTGTLMNSIKILSAKKDRSQIAVDVGSDVEYARRVEYGFVGVDSKGRNYNQPPKPFLRPAIDENERIIKRKITKKIRDRI
ncbi:HK97-gp10 family putative phage morphogenesis protein [Methanosalsum natronophilum]|uniref:HK97-gp10 family putative phage morphogenesis protein n=1 Tax=Methanosalsum natronophilum TaxID=768733 RepID=UPI002168EB1F|nr:HK97-gp10 family putative phage morphogenesis protein [Methanosalsum natronophilum]MCS3923827.1 HK97 gp10 family phage protein [Methanosalsum natronophilum]